MNSPVSCCLHTAGTECSLFFLCCYMCLLLKSSLLFSCFKEPFFPAFITTNSSLWCPWPNKAANFSHKHRSLFHSLSKSNDTKSIHKRYCVQLIGYPQGVVSRIDLFGLSFWTVSLRVLLPRCLGLGEAWRQHHPHSPATQIMAFHKGHTSKQWVSRF